MTASHLNVSSSGDAVDTMRRLEGIVASAMDGIITINDRQEVILFNPAAERMFGLPAAEAIGQPITRFMPQRYRATHTAHIQRFAVTGVSSRQMGSLGAISGLRANGEEFPIEASISQVEVGSEQLATVILRDITERKAAEDALIESRRRMEGIVESAMDAMITVDEDQRVVLFNPAAERMFGVLANDAIGAPIVQFIPQRFRDGHAEHIRRFKETGVTNRRMGALGTVSGLRASGEEFPVEASISQVEIGGAKIATVILRDIAERKVNEEARLLLAREVDHRAKNVLAVVQALVSLTQAATKEEFTAAVRGRVSALGRAHSLLAENRWEGGDMRQIVDDETAPYQKPGQIEVSGPTLVLGPHAVQPISLLIHEMATNAVKYGALSVEEGQVEVEWRILPDHELELRWTERGGPIVREPASRGFGSTLVREVATRQLAGSIDITWPAEGVRLIATLPSSVYRPDAPRPTLAAKEDEMKEQTASATGRLLVVEDEALLAMELCSDLSQLGWDIIGPASTIEEALRLINQAPLPTAAVLDVNLHGQPVYPLAERLQELGVPFVFCTGYQQLDDNKAFFTSPIVRKPVNINMLDRELRRLRQVA
jgi:PAS domain S-box-containing protein